MENNSQATQIDFPAIEKDLQKSLQEVLGLAKILPHDQIFDFILSQIKRFDFSKITGEGKNGKLSQREQIVITVSEIIKIFPAQNFGIACQRGSVFIFNGAYWKKMNQDLMKNFFGCAASKLGINDLHARFFDFEEKLFKQSQAAAFLKNQLADGQTTLVNLRNGTFEISSKSQKLREFRREDFLVYQLGFSYDETADCPKFLSYLDQVLPDLTLQKIVAEFFGYAFTKGLKLEKAALFYGDGANGKSVLFDIMNALFGKENVSNFSLSNLSEDYNRALIEHALLNYGSEINAGKIRDEFKVLVSGEPIQIRLKYANSDVMENYAKLAFNCNELPRDIEHSHAFFRRLLIIPFEVIIPADEQNKKLAEEIIGTELPGIFNWILGGLKRLLENQKFTESQVADDLLASYKLESDSVAMFIEESPSILHEPLKHAYIGYRSHCASNGLSALGRGNFSKRLKKLGFMLERSSCGYIITGQVL